MATTVSIGGTTIDYSEFQVGVVTSPIDVAPSASVVTNSEESITAGDSFTITIDGTTVFDGETRSGGTINRLGQVSVEAAHPARDLFEETVSIDVTGPPTTQEVLQAALNDANSGGSFTLDYPGTALSLDNDYSAEDRSVKRVFRDMVDRAERVWWVDPGGTTIHVETSGGGGLWQSINTQTDSARLDRFDKGNVDTVRNDVTVVGTGEVQVRASASDATSISTYGRRTGNSPYNVEYATTESEAQALANALLVPDPQVEGELLVGSNVGDVTQPLVNQTVDVTDDGKNVNVTGQVIERQTIRQGRAELGFGPGAGISIADVNRRTKSREDITEPGSVFTRDRIAANTITAQEIDVAELEAGALSVSGQGGAPSPSNSGIFFQYDPVPNELSLLHDGNVFFGADGDRLDEGYFLSLTANTFTGGTFNGDVNGNVDGNLDGDVTSESVVPTTDNTGTVGSSTSAYSSVWAYSFIDASTGSAINDGGDVLASLERGQRPPDHARVTDDDGTELGIRVNELTRHLWDICAAQQSRLEALEDTVADLESRLTALESQG